jgi:hypothetical protein
MNNSFLDQEKEREKEERETGEKAYIVQEKLDVS